MWGHEKDASLSDSSDRLSMPNTTTNSAIQEELSLSFESIGVCLVLSNLRDRSGTAAVRKAAVAGRRLRYAQRQTSLASRLHRPWSIVKIQTRSINSGHDSIVNRDIRADIVVCTVRKCLVWLKLGLETSLSKPVRSAARSSSRPL